MSVARINGREVTPAYEETILAAAARMGIEIPTLCFDERYPAEGGCRMCLVHAEDTDLPLAACHTPLEIGMDIQTHHIEVEKLRRSLLRLQVGAAGFTEFDAGSVKPGRFADLLQLYGIEIGNQKKHSSAVFRDTSHPMIEQTPGACLHCRLCVTACRDAGGQSVFGISGRGSSSRVVISGRENLSESSCIACGACVDACPTGAVSDRDRRRRLPSDAEVVETETVCGYCSVGCRIQVTACEDRILRIDGVRAAATNDGLLCQKGRFGHTFQFSWDRLSKPMIREGAGFREVSWEEALTFTAGRIRETIESAGPDAFGALASTRATNESNYLLQKLCRTVIGTNNIDSAARLCHAGTAEVLRGLTGASAATASFSDIENSACLVIAGANPAESHPILAARIRAAVTRGARLIVIDPRRTELADLADVHLRNRPGSDTTLYLALAWLVAAQIEGHWKEAVDNAADFEAFLAHFPIDSVPELAGIEAGNIAAAAEHLVEASGSILFLPGLGLIQQHHGIEAIRALFNLAILTDCCGRPGAGILPPGGQNNLQGCLDMGCAPGWLPGDWEVGDPEANRRFQESWGVDLPSAPGKTSREMLSAGGHGDLRALWVMGHDVLHSHSEESQVISALEKLDLLIIQDLFYSDLCRHADILLPAASHFEQAGTFTNAERRVQPIRPSVAAPEEARPDWAIITLMARRLGADWPYQDARQVLTEISRVIPERFGGMNEFRFDQEPDGIQWPCPEPDHPGTERLPLREKPALFIPNLAAEPEPPDDDYPYELMTGRRLEHYNAGSMTRRNPGRYLFDHDTVDLHPGDALREGILNGDRVQVVSRHGEARATARITERILPGTAFMTFHFPQTHVNRVIGPAADPESGCPQFKATTVRITSAPEKKDG